jgi:tetratricopeptide (TPR) repeat protein
MKTRAHRIRCAAGAALALLVSHPAAFAQEPARRALSPDERARELYLRGDRLYAEGSYDQAVAAFEQAYRLSRRPGLLYNMANALERLGRYEEALRRLNEYAPNAPEHQRNTVLKRIQALELRAEEQRQRETNASDGAKGAAPLPLSPSAKPALAPAAVAEATPPERWLGYAVGGGGLLSVGVGFALAAASARREVEERCVHDGAALLCPESVDRSLSERRSRALVADVAFGLGIAAVGVGVYLILDAEPESAPKAQLRSAFFSDGGKIDLVTIF